MGVNGKQDETRYIIFQQKTRKNGKTGGKTLLKKPQEKKKKKIQEIQKRDFDKVSGNAENGNEFSTRFWEMLKTKTRTKTMSS